MTDDNKTFDELDDSRKRPSANANGQTRRYVRRTMDENNIFNPEASAPAADASSDSNITTYTPSKRVFNRSKEGSNLSKKSFSGLEQWRHVAFCAKPFKAIWC